MALVDPALNLVFVVELCFFRLIAKEQPVLSRTTVVDALFHEGSERRNAGSGADHDDVRVLVLGEDEGFGQT